MFRNLCFILFQPYGYVQLVTIVIAASLVYFNIHNVVMTDLDLYNLGTGFMKDRKTIWGECEKGPSGNLFSEVEVLVKGVQMNFIFPNFCPDIQSQIWVWGGGLK